MNLLPMSRSASVTVLGFERYFNSVSRTPVMRLSLVRRCAGETQHVDPNWASARSKRVRGRTSDLFGAHRWCIWRITRPIEHGRSTGRRSRNADIDWSGEYVTQLVPLKAFLVIGAFLLQSSAYSRRLARA